MTDLEDRLERHLERIAASAEPMRNVHAVLNTTPRGRTEQRARSRLRLPAVAAAVLLLAGALGLVAITNRPAPAGENQPSRSQSTVAESPPLAKAQRLERTDWVVASEPPSGTQLLLARRDIAEPDEIRVVAYGPPDLNEPDLQLVIEIDRTPSPSSGSTITVAGASWSLNVAEPGGWNVSRHVGDSYVEVRGTGDIDEELIATLLVVNDAELPLVPLGRRADADLVAQTRLGDQSYNYEVQQSGRFRCGWVGTPTRTEAHTCGAIAPDAALVIEGTHWLGGGPGAINALGWGSAAPNVETVEVEFSDGTIVTADTTDLSAVFDERFWIAGTTVGEDQTNGSRASELPVAAVRAYDGEGSLIAAETPDVLG